jgi:hypothetical protein
MVAKEPVDNVIGYDKTGTKEFSGIFYRQDIAYRISAKSATVNKEAILYSPSQSQDLFLPISRSLFADSTATLTFEDGMPTGYTQDDKSELVGLFTIPAKVVSAYFGAVGQLFTAFSKKNTDESALIKSDVALELEKHNAERDLELAKTKADYKFELAEIKVKACKAAETAKPRDQALIDSLGCD